MVLCALSAFVLLSAVHTTKAHALLFGDIWKGIKKGVSSVASSKTGARGRSAQTAAGAQQRQGAGNRQQATGNGKPEMPEDAAA
jgi:hypothetical protein